MLDADRLVEQTVEETGLDDLGADLGQHGLPSTGNRLEGLDRLVDSLNAEAQLTELGELSLEFQITTSLRNRLQVVDWAKHHPEVTHAPIERPLIVIGLPRTGTTLLSYLLDCDPARRSLLRWESRHSVPPPTTEALRTDPRVAMVEAESAVLDEINPEFKAIHYEAADGPTEDVTILAQDFRSMLWECVANVPSYSSWLLSDCDFRPAYAYHRLELQVLQSRAPGTWSLKTPQHCLSLDTMFATYPDARVVMTHRDPVAVTASMVSLARSLTGTFTDADHTDYLRSHWPNELIEMVDRVMAWRDANGDDRIVDVHYDDLTRDPMGTMAGLYDAVGDPFTADVEARMHAYMDANPQGKHGGHRYDPESLGLEVDEITERFSRYTDRYVARDVERSIDQELTS